MSSVWFCKSPRCGLAHNTNVDRCTCGLKKPDRAGGQQCFSEPFVIGPTLSSATSSAEFSSSSSSFSSSSASTTSSSSCLLSAYSGVENTSASVAFTVGRPAAIEKLSVSAVPAATTFKTSHQVLVQGAKRPFAESNLSRSSTAVNSVALAEDSSDDDHCNELRESNPKVPRLAGPSGRFEAQLKSESMDSSASPQKKIFTAASNRGKPNPLVKQHFKDIAGGRKRCNLCFAKWFSESVAVQVLKGISEEEAKALVGGKTPPEESVKSFNKTGTGNMLKHLVFTHQINTDAAPPPPSNQPGIKAAFSAARAKSDDSARKVALVFCMNPGLPFRLASEPFFAQCYGRPLATGHLPSVISELASELKGTIKREMMGSNVGLALDGWTNWRHRKTFNLFCFGPALLFSGRLYRASLASPHPS